MATVGVDDGSLQVDSHSQRKLVGLIWWLEAAWCLVCIHLINQVNSHKGLATMTVL